MDQKFPERSPELVRKATAVRLMATSHSGLYRWIRTGLMTRPVRFGKMRAAWPLYEVDAICRARIGGLSDAGIRDLVDSLHEEREQLLASMS